MNVFSKFLKKNVFSKLDEDIITFHILPHLDGKTLIILSSVSSQFHNLIWKNINNNSDLWRNICTSRWPSLLTNFPETDFLSEVISMLPGGYRSFFSDAFASIHPPINNPSPPCPPSLRRPKTFFFYAVDIFLHGEQQPLYSLHTVKLIDTSEYVPTIFFENYVPPIFEFELHHGKAELNFVKVKKEGCLEYLKEKLTFSCVAIDPLGIKRAGSLFTYGCKAVSAKPVTLGMTSRVKVLFETVLPVPETLTKVYTDMVKCQIKVMCLWEGEREDKFHVKLLYFTMKDMDGRPLLETHGAAVILNAVQNGERRGRNIYMN